MDGVLFVGQMFEPDQWWKKHKEETKGEKQFILPWLRDWKVLNDFFFKKEKKKKKLTITNFIFDIVLFCHRKEWTFLKL
jgi:hypothetical protein